MKHPTSPLTTWISVEEMEDAKEDVIEVAQKQVFLEAFLLLHDHKVLRSPELLITCEKLKKNAALKSLQSLNPFFAEGVLRVGGRLQNSDLPLESKHPISTSSDGFAHQGFPRKRRPHGRLSGAFKCIKLFQNNLCLKK